MPNVDVPGLGVVEFPDEMSQSDIEGALRKHTERIAEWGTTQAGALPGQLSTMIQRGALAQPDALPQPPTPPTPAPAADMMDEMTVSSPIGVPMRVSLPKDPTQGLLTLPSATVPEDLSGDVTLTTPTGVPMKVPRKLAAQAGGALYNVAKSVPEFMTSPAGAATALLPETALGKSAMQGLFAGLAAKGGAEALGEASVTGDTQKALEGALMLGTSPLLAKPTLPQMPRSGLLEGPLATGELLQMPPRAVPQPKPRAPRPEVPATQPEPQRALTVIEEIRAMGAKTKEQIRELFPQLSREQAAQLRDKAWGPPPSTEAIAAVRANLPRGDILEGLPGGQDQPLSPQAEGLLRDILQGQKGAQNAEAVRTYPGQLPEARKVAAESQAVGGNDVEQAAPGQPEPLDKGKEVQGSEPLQPLTPEQQAEERRRLDEELGQETPVDNPITEGLQSKTYDISSGAKEGKGGDRKKVARTSQSNIQTEQGTPNPVREVVESGTKASRFVQTSGPFKDEVVVSPSTREPGRWQVTLLKDPGDGSPLEPSGHATFDTKEEAIRSAKGETVNGVPGAGSKSFQEVTPPAAPKPESPPVEPSAEPAPARDWDLFNENLADDMQTDVRGTGKVNYVLSDVADRFVEFAKKDTSGKPLDKLVSEFAKTDEASVSQIRKLRQSVKSLLEQEKTEPAPATAHKEPWQMTQADYVAKDIATRKGVSPKFLPKMEELARQDHQAEVQHALRQGKPVPPEVLADYPDLKPPPSPAQAKGETGGGVETYNLETGKWEKNVPPLPRVGMRFFHKQILDPTTMGPNPKPQMFEVSSIRQGRIYYRPVYRYEGGRIEVGKTKEYTTPERWEKVFSREATSEEHKYGSTLEQPPPPPVAKVEEQVPPSVPTETAKPVEKVEQPKGRKRWGENTTDEEKAWLKKIYDTRSSFKPTYTGVSKIYPTLEDIGINRQQFAKLKKKGLVEDRGFGPSTTLAGELEFNKELQESFSQIGTPKSPEPLPPTAPPAEKGPYEGDISMGPGAAPAGGKTKAQIEQLTDAFRGVSGKKVPVSEKLREAFSVGERLSTAKDTLSKAVSGLKASGDYLIGKWKHGLTEASTWDSLMRAKGELSAAIEARGWRVKQWVKIARKATPSMRDQAAIAKWVDAGGDPVRLRQGLAEAPDKYKQAYQDALNLSGDLKTAAQNIQNYFESRLQEAIDAGVLKEGVEDYIHRLYESKPKQAQKLIAHVQNGLLARNPDLAKKRVFDFDWEAEKLGYKPVQSYITRIAAYEQSLSKAIAAREFIKKATTMAAADGRPIIDVKGVGIPVNDPVTGEREATLIKPQFNPAKSNVVGTPNYRGDYVNKEFPALSKWKWVASDSAGKPILVQGDVAIHPDYVSRISALLEPSRVRYGRYGHVLGPALNFGSAVKQTMLDLSLFHPVQVTVHGMEHRIMPWSIVKDIDLNDPKTQGLLRGGVTLGGDYHGMAGEGLAGGSLTRHIPMLGPVLDTYHQWLFQDYIPRLKMTMAHHALDRNMKRYAGIKTPEEIYNLTASEANAAFGEQNYIMLERSKTAQDMARLILLAPDFLEARGRFAGQALTKGGKAFGNEQRTALLLGALTMYATARLLNKAISGQSHNEPDNLFSVVIDGKSYGLRTVQGDILHMLERPLQFWMHRLNPVYGRTFLEAMTQRDEFGRKRTAPQMAWDAVSTAVPISLRSSRERSLWESIANSFGITARRFNDVDTTYKLAQKWKEQNGVPERGEFIYDPDKDPLRGLKIALSNHDQGGAVNELDKVLASKAYTPQKLDDYFKRYAALPFAGSKANDAKFAKTLTEDEKKTLDAAREHKKAMLRLYQQAKAIRGARQGRAGQR